MKHVRYLLAGAAVSCALLSTSALAGLMLGTGHSLTAPAAGTKMTVYGWEKPVLQQAHKGEHRIVDPTGKNRPVTALRIANLSNQSQKMLVEQYYDGKPTQSTLTVPVSSYAVIRYGASSDRNPVLPDRVDVKAQTDLTTDKFIELRAEFAPPKTPAG